MDSGDPFRFRHTTPFATLSHLQLTLGEGVRGQEIYVQPELIPPLWVIVTTIQQEFRRRDAALQERLDQMEQRLQAVEGFMNEIEHALHGSMP